MEFDRGSLPPRRWLLRGAVAVLICALLAPAAYAAINPQTVGLGPGTVEEPADEVTYVTSQGFHFEGYGNAKKPARLAAADAEAQPRWSVDGSAVDARWFYDVDPMENGNLFVTATNAEGTLALEFDPDQQRAVRTEEFDLKDTHNSNRLDEHRLLVANMREYENGVSDDRLYIRNVTAGETEWEWVFREHYANDTAGGFGEDWTHVNDAEFVGEGERYVLASPRNFDQAVVIDRETDEVVMRLGEDGNHDVLYAQHNPDYMEREDGTPVMLVADSENDRVVEYERDCGDADPRLGAGTPPENCEWDLVWSVDGFNWPRDADRLPNGNTLVADTLNHRVVEITPDGEVVWEFHAPWAPYDAERGERASDGPTMADAGTGGNATVHGGDDSGPANRYTVADAIADGGTAVGSGSAEELASRWAHFEPWIRPVWMGSWAMLSALVGLLVALLWGGTELLVNRKRVAAGVRNGVGGVGQRIRGD